MKRFRRMLAYEHSDDFAHIKDEFNRHAQASTLSASFLTLFTSPVILVDEAVKISSEHLVASAAIFLFFSFLPDVIRFFCGIFKLPAVDRLSHSFAGALLFPGLLMLALAPLDAWMLPFFILGFLGYLLHLFVDSIESAIEWWIGLAGKVLSGPPFTSLKRRKQQK